MIALIQKIVGPQPGRPIDLLEPTLGINQDTHHPKRKIVGVLINFKQSKPGRPGQSERDLAFRSWAFSYFRP